MFKPCKCSIQKSAVAAEAVLGRTKHFTAHTGAAAAADMEIGAGTAQGWKFSGTGTKRRHLRRLIYLADSTCFKIAEAPGIQSIKITWVHAAVSLYNKLPVTFSGNSACSLISSCKEVQQIVKQLNASKVSV